MNALFARVAESDCEALHAGLLDQPVNAWTSLAMVGAGLLIAFDVRRRHLRREALVFALAVAFAGIGSFLFHGFDSEFGQWAHDVSLISVLAVMTGVQLGRAIGRPFHAAWWATAALAVGGALLAFVPDATNALVGALIVAIGGAEIVSRRRGRRPLLGFWMILLAALGVTAFLLGRTDAPLCDPASEFQLHGLWHLLIPAVAMLWTDRAFAPNEPRRSGWARAAISRSVVALARLASRALLQDVEFVGADRLPAGAPLLIVSNHFNGFVDPVLVVTALSRLPRGLPPWRVGGALPGGNHR